MPAAIFVEKKQSTERYEVPSDTSTQLPQICLRHGLGQRPLLFRTQLTGLLSKCFTFFVSLVHCNLCMAAQHSVQNAALTVLELRTSLFHISPKA